VPAAARSDVVAFIANRNEQHGVPSCEPWSHTDLNRAWVPPAVPDGVQGYSRPQNRRVALMLPDGHAILQHTQKNETDLSVRERTPGWIS
jgi:hypothetical protein